MAGLLLKGQEGKRWYPTPINALEAQLGLLLQPTSGVPDKKCWGIKKNLAYALQYLEFTARVISDLDLSSVLEIQTFKSFIIHGCSVIEGVFYYVLVKSGKHNQTEWASETKVSSEVAIGGKSYRIVTEYFTKLPKPLLKEMTFDAMCKHVEKKDLIKLSNDFYKNLPYLRDLRNRIHLHSVESYAESDYNKFDRKDFELMKKMLKALLTSDLFPKCEKSLPLEFLDPKK
jgi:hypothetical protein